VTSFDVQGERCPLHLPHAARFGGDRWERFLIALGVQPVGDCVYRRNG
jgi:hypothetical protein